MSDADLAWLLTAIKVVVDGEGESFEIVVSLVFNEDLEEEAAAAVAGLSKAFRFSWEQLIPTALLYLQGRRITCQSRGL